MVIPGFISKGDRSILMLFSGRGNVPQIIILLTFCMMLFADTGLAQAEAEVGHISFTRGLAWVQRGDTRENAETDALLYKDDVVVTGARGRMKLILKDGSKVYVGSNSRIALNKYAMEGENLVDASFDMFWGRARFFVNKMVVKKSSFSVRTTTAVLGVRGTEFLVLVPPTPELLNRAFEKIDYASLPALPTRMVLIQGIVDVATKQGFRQRITAGKTTDIDVSGKATVRETKETDADVDQQLSAPVKTPASKETSGSAATGTVADTGTDTGTDLGTLDTLPEQVSTAPPLISKPKVAAGSTSTAAPPPVNATITNTIQNLGATTDVRIKPSFVVP